MVQAMTQPQGSTAYGGTRVHSWINANATQISVHVGSGVCKDPESGISKMRMWVGSRRNGIGDVLARREVAAETVVTLPITPLATLSDQLECTQCGPDTVVGIECVNGAAQSTICQRYSSFRVDGSPPTCKDDFVVLGDGRRRGFQSSTSMLQLSNFEFALEDRETGIARVEYLLENVAAVDESGLPLPNSSLAPPLSLDLAGHDGLPSNRMRISGLRLEHGHTYRILFRAINLVNLVGGWCHTSSVVIDTSPPLAGPVVVLQHDSQNEVAFPEARFYQYSLTVMRIAARNFTDPQSDILGYAATVFRASDGWVMQPETPVGSREFTTLGVELEDGAACNGGGFEPLALACSGLVSILRPASPEP